MCIKVYELDPVKFISTTGLAWKADLKKKKFRLELLADFDMSLMVEKRYQGRNMWCNSSVGKS